MAGQHVFFIVEVQEMSGLKLNLGVIYEEILSVCSVAQSCQTLCGPMDCRPPAYSVHGIF